MVETPLIWADEMAQEKRVPRANREVWWNETNALVCPVSNLRSVVNCVCDDRGARVGGATRIVDYRCGFTGPGRSQDYAIIRRHLGYIRESRFVLCFPES